MPTSVQNLREPNVGRELLSGAETLAVVTSLFGKVPELVEHIVDGGLVGRLLFPRSQQTFELECPQVCVLRPTLNRNEPQFRRKIKEQLFSDPNLRPGSTHPTILLSCNARGSLVIPVKHAPNNVKPRNESNIN